MVHETSTGNDCLVYKFVQKWFVVKFIPSFWLHPYSTFFPMNITENYRLPIKRGYFLFDQPCNKGLTISLVRMLYLVFSKVVIFSSKFAWYMVSDDCLTVFASGWCEGCKGWIQINPPCQRTSCTVQERVASDEAN